MAKKEEKNILQKIYDYPLEEIMGDSFGRYSKYIIQERALPDVRDGLKPVQRRILFSMYKDKFFHDKPTKKSATTVGNVIGKYHPHGDTSVYDAMVRMSQDWKQREPLIEMQGNNGSIDGDGAAAYRYTEARLTKIAGVLLKDLEKDCVLMSPNFDDELLEPTVMPAHFPHLLVNGASGISAGYATNMPTHNLGEVIDATIKRIDSPNCRLETIMDLIPGPDFPTGGIIEGKKGIIDAYTKGRGKIVVKSKIEVVKEKGKISLIVTEIPYEVLKINIIRKIEEIRIDKKIDGISEVRDETDKTSKLRIVVELKKDANSDLILNYLLKNTDLQINYNFNNVAIVDKRPKTLGIVEIIDAFIAHQREVIKLRSEFDLKLFNARLHIIEGLIKMLSILDEVIRCIRGSKNKSDAKVNLVKEFEFTEKQAEAIVMMQLYKLTNTDITELENEFSNLKLQVEALNLILSDEEVMKKTMKDELRSIKKEYATPRITEIKDEVTEIKIDTTALISKEDYIVITTNDGYIKKVSIKSYNMSESDETGLKEGDFVTGIYRINNLNTVLMFTNRGNYLYVPVHEIPELKYKDLGKHISSIIKVSDGERVIKTFGISDFNNDDIITAFTKNGMVKRMAIESFVVQRYSKPVMMFKLKNDDEVINININKGSEALMVSKLGYAVKYNTDEIPVVGLKTSGVIGMKLVGDELLNAFVSNPNNEYVTIFTDKNTAKRIKFCDINKTSRAKKGSLILKSPKSKKYNILNILYSNSKDELGLLVNNEIKYIKSSEINIMDQASVGGMLSIKGYTDTFVKEKLKDIKKEDKSESNEEVIKDPEKEEKQAEKVAENMTMSDFFDDFKI